jgi:hypothetical protein
VDTEKELQDRIDKSYRSNGDMVCSICKKKYIDHPMEKDILGYNEEPYLHKLCNGDLVKL